MKRILRVITILILSINMFFILCSCRMAESYKEFIIKNIPDSESPDYFSSEKFDFATVENVVILPKIKAINYEKGEYNIFVRAYSETGTEKVRVKNMAIKENGNVLLDHALDMEIPFEENVESIFNGEILAITFTKETWEIVDGKEFNLIVTVDVTKNDISTSKEITFEMAVKGYVAPVLPT